MSIRSLKIAIIIGTRPEIIKMAPVIDEIERRKIKYVLIHTGQHYDYQMSDQFFVDLNLRKPDYNINVGSGSSGKQIANMIKKIEKVLLIEKPDIVLVQGDTNTALSGALISSKLHLPVGHIEAGLRSYDKTMPEEINREVADVCSKIFFAPTEDSAINLLFAGISPKNIFITGNTIVDACIRNLKIAKKKSKLNFNFDNNKTILTVTIHRAENVDNLTRIENIVKTLINLNDFLIIFPAHPRTVKNLKKYNLFEKIKKTTHIKLIKPIGYFDFLFLLSKSKLIMTDSGGIQEEAITLNIPCVTLRYNTERPETVAAGGNILVGTENAEIVKTVKNILNNVEIYSKMSRALNPYGDGNSSKKIINIIVKFFKEDKLKMVVPENIMKSKMSQLIKVDQEMTVNEFEKKNRGLEIKMVFENGQVLFPVDHLNLKNKIILFDGLKLF